MSACMCVRVCACVRSWLQGYRMSKESGPVGVNVTCVRVSQLPW